MKEKTLYEIFKTAISGEQQAQRLYKLGAELAGEGTQLGALFKELGEMERSHEDTLLKQYAILKKKLGLTP